MEDILINAQKPMLRRPGIFDAFEGLAAAESTRHGGVSQAPYNSLNLGKNTDNAPEAVAENRRRFCAALGFRPDQTAWSKQVHGDEVRVVTKPGGAEGFDALVTNVPGILLCVSVADCTPILVFDARNKAVAAIHAGWRGTVAEIVLKTLQKMQHLYGTQGADCAAFVGTCIDLCSFEVGDEVAAEFIPAFKQFNETRGKYFVDLKAANAAQLRTFGVPETQIEVSPFSTVLHVEDYFSHRMAKGITGRMQGAIGLSV